MTNKYSVNMEYMSGALDRFASEVVIPHVRDLLNDYCFEQLGRGKGPNAYDWEECKGCHQTAEESPDIDHEADCVVDSLERWCERHGDGR